MEAKGLAAIATGGGSVLSIGLLVGLGLALWRARKIHFVAYLIVALLASLPFAIVVTDTFGSKMIQGEANIIMVGAAAVLLTPFAVGWIVGWLLGRAAHVLERWVKLP